jgi:hypothetical protein
MYKKMSQPENKPYSDMIKMRSTLSGIWGGEIAQHRAILRRIGGTKTDPNKTDPNKTIIPYTVSADSSRFTWLRKLNNGR